RGLRLHGPPGPLFHDGGQPGPEQRQPVLGLRAGREHQGQGVPRVDELRRPAPHRHDDQMKTRRPPEGADRGGHMSHQRGLSLMGLIVTLAVVGFLGIMAAKLLPAYIEYWSVRKIFAAMDQNGDTNGTVADIRRHYETRNAIEDVKSVRG